MLKISMDDIHLMIDKSDNSCKLAAGKVLEILKDLSGLQRELHDIRVPLLTCVLKSAKKSKYLFFQALSKIYKLETTNATPEEYLVTLRPILKQIMHIF
ncbi:hypothetical protein CDAR_39441 [Caerostris darwini]|uniref:Uncharacterized protein n=1 Tax=Caerostris darwini TaxID=1538125 RepID=A0AAV4U6F9_9ARAC|nr:hypothetical protein CDAR_39441 [Caerostris darwini]